MGRARPFAERLPIMVGAVGAALWALLEGAGWLFDVMDTLSEQGATTGQAALALMALAVLVFAGGLAYLADTAWLARLFAAGALVMCLVSAAALMSIPGGTHVGFIVALAVLAAFAVDLALRVAVED